MTIDEIYSAIATQKPPIIYISGKTSTGKSTFGRKLHDELGYHTIELEAVLLEIVQKHQFDEQSTFRKVFYEPEDFEAKTLFLKATDQIIADALAKDRPTVIEGAVANVETLNRLLRSAGDLFFLYFHPSDLTTYTRNLTKRFMESDKDSYGGLPLKFWQLIDHEEFAVFCTTRKLTDNLESSIKQYAQMSQKESLTRLNAFREKFKQVVVIEIRP